MDYPLLNQQGSQIGTVQLRDDVFGLTPNTSVVHQAMVRQLANARQGTSSTKTRGEVAGSTKKLFKQKGTGRARQGGARAPHRRHGGIVFGPKPRSYRQAMPKKMRRLAIRSVLSAKAADGELLLLDSLNLEAPKTKEMRSVIDALKLEGATLVVMSPPSENVVLAARNLPGVYTLPAQTVSVGTMLAHKYLVMTLDAARAAEALWGLAAAESKEEGAA
jgi:large subunit ribosomal protein L4